MSLNARTLNEEEFFYGHKACAGCGGSLAVRIALKVLGERSIAVLPAGCMSAVGFNFPQLCFGQLLAWGQYVLGLGLAGFVLAPLFGVPPAFGNLLEIGFQGGHGTVGSAGAGRYSQRRPSASTYGVSPSSFAALQSPMTSQ